MSDEGVYLAPANLRGALPLLCPWSRHRKQRLRKSSLSLSSFNNDITTNSLENHPHREFDLVHSHHHFHHFVVPHGLSSSPASQKYVHWQPLKLVKDSGARFLGQNAVFGTATAGSPKGVDQGLNLLECDEPLYF